MWKLMDWIHGVKHAEIQDDGLPYTMSNSIHMDFYSNDVGIKIMPKKGYALYEMDIDLNFTKVVGPPSVITGIPKNVKVLLVQNIAEHEHEKEKHTRFQLGVE